MGDTTTPNFDVLGRLNHGWNVGPAFPHEEDDQWRTQAACIGHSDMFFPEVGHGRDKAREAKAMCATCPVIDQCRDYALRTAPIHGIWAGMSYRELRADRMKRRRAAS